MTSRQIANWGIILAAAVVVIPKRHVYFHRDPKSQETLLEIHQDSKLMPFRQIGRAHV